MVKKEDIVYTAWWYQSQNYTTGDRWLWRKHGLLENEAFFLINVTCATREELRSQVSRLLHQNIIGSQMDQTNLAASETF
ncbi:MAG: hypothetical protein AAFO69_16070 [Bacteroidota bacterium]